MHDFYYRQVQYTRRLVYCVFLSFHHSLYIHRRNRTTRRIVVLSVPGAYDLSSASFDRFGTGLTWWSSSRAWRSSSSWGRSDFRASSLFALAGTHASCPSRLRSKTTARLAHCQTDVRWTPGSFSDSEDRGEWRRKGDVLYL